MKYFRRRLPALVVLGLIGSGAASPAALACSQHTPVAFWERALQSVSSGDTMAAALPAGRMTTAAAAHAAAAGKSKTESKTESKSKAAPKKKDPANATPRKRWITGSKYIDTTAPSLLRAEGCKAGREHRTGLVILAFGKPAYNGHTYGTILFSNRFAGNFQITSATKAYAVGYAKCLPQDSDAVITLSRGTSNYNIDVPNAVNAGKRWARETKVLQTWLDEHPGIGDHVKSAAAIDAEPAWNPSFHRTHAFFKGYRAFFGDDEDGLALYNFGSLDGGVGEIWSLRQAFYVSGGMKFARVVPEIYFPSMARQWAELARLARERYDREVQFAGLMTQRAPGCGPSRCGMGPVQAHRTLKRALASAKATRELANRLGTVTNIN